MLQLPPLPAPFADVLVRHGSLPARNQLLASGKMVCTSRITADEENLEDHVLIK